MSLLVGIYNHANSLVSRLTAARAALIDRLDATVSSRAPASTAVSNASYTADRAALIDRLDTTVSSRAPADTAVSSASYTSTRAALLDRLDATISSRAPASTAVSNANYTAARAALLDRLDATIASRAVASSALNNAVWTDAKAALLDAAISSRAAAADWTGARAEKLDLLGTAAAIGSVIKSIQTGYTTHGTSSGTAGVGEDTRYVDVTVSAINPEKTIVIQDVSRMYQPNDSQLYGLSVRVINSTTIRVSVSYNSSTTSGSLSTRWQLIEFN